MFETSEVSRLVQDTISVWASDLLSRQEKRRRKALQDLEDARKDPTQLPIICWAAQICGTSPKRFFQLLEPILNKLTVN